MTTSEGSTTALEAVFLLLFKILWWVWWCSATSRGGDCDKVERLSPLPFLGSRLEVLSCSEAFSTPTPVADYYDYYYLSWFLLVKFVSLGEIYLTFVIDIGDKILAGKIFTLVPAIQGCPTLATFYYCQVDPTAELSTTTTEVLLLQKESCLWRVLGWISAVCGMGLLAKKKFW